MENFDVSTFCIECKARLKRQVIGSNVFYYCRNCGRMSSEFCLSGESGMGYTPKPLPAKVSPATKLDVSENSQKVVVET